MCWMCVEVGVGVMMGVVLLVVGLRVRMVRWVLVLVRVGVVGWQRLVLVWVGVHVMVRRLVLPGTHHFHHVAHGVHVPVRHGSRVVSQRGLQPHFGFRVHWLDLGGSTGLAQVGPLHAQDAGVH